MKKFNSIKLQILHRIGVIVLTAITMLGCASVPAPTEPIKPMIIAEGAISNANSTVGDVCRTQINGAQHDKK